MEPNLDQVAKELYGKIQTRFPDIKIADESAEVLSKKEDIPKARFFEFEYSEHGEPLGTIAISLDADDGIVIKASGDLVDDADPDDTHHGAYQFIRSFRKFARAHMLNYEVNNMGKSNLNKRDYEFHAKSGEEPMMESKMWGTSKVSYQDLGETRLVVKHSKPVNTELAAGRTMHIESIYIENKQGERFRYPVRHLNGARAMAQHIGHGGNPYDAIGQHVVSLSEEMSKLRMFKGYVSRTPVVSEAMGTVNDKVIERIESIKKELHHLQNSKYYESFAESFAPQESKEIPEEIMLDWVDRLTVRSFKEELKDVFPYIYKIVDESELPVAELDPEDILSEAPTFQDVGRMKLPSGNMDREYQSKVQQACIGGRGTGMFFQPDPRDIPFISAERAKLGLPPWKTAGSPSPAAQFESFMDSLLEGEKDAMSGDENAVQGLKDEIAKGELKGDLNQSSVVGEFIKDQELLDILDKTSGNDDAWPIVKAWMDQKDPDLANELFADYNPSATGTEETPPAPEEEVAPPAPEEEVAPQAPGGEEAPPAPGAPPAAPPAPVAESDDPPWHDKTPYDAPKGTFKKKVKSGGEMDRARALAQKFAKKGATPQTKVGDKTLHDMMLEFGLTPEECGMKPQGDKEMAPPTEPTGDSYEDMKKFASGFFNPEKKNFVPGGTGMKVKIDKQFPGANPADKKRIMHDIERTDPSSSLRETERILRLAGLKGN